MEWQHPEGAVVSDDPERLDLDLVWRWLSTESYWARGRSLEAVRQSFARSLGLGLYLPEGQVGVCRWLSDGVSFAWLCDVFLAAEVRGRGLGTWMVSVGLEHPAIRGRGASSWPRPTPTRCTSGSGSRPSPSPRWMERLGPGP